LKQAFWLKEIGPVRISEDVFWVHVSKSRIVGERDTVKGRMKKRSPISASTIRYRIRTKHYKINRKWAFERHKLFFANCSIAVGV
jgi:hypothetical protein